MPIPGNLIIANIQSEPYYEEYLEKVAKHQRYLAADKGSDPDSPAPKPAKATKKSKPLAPKADPRPPVTKSASSQQTKPKPAPAKSKGKKRKLVTETSDKPSSARRSNPGLEPRFNDEEADVQRALEECLKSIFDAPRGPLLTVVIREPESGKYQPLLEVQGKGKEKVTNEQVFLNLLTLQTPKKKSLADYEVEFDEDVLRIDAGVPDEGHAGQNPGDQDKGQAGPNPDEQDEGHTGPNPGDTATSQPLPSLVIHAGPNLEHMELEVINVSTQPHSEQIDEGFTATAYPKGPCLLYNTWGKTIEADMKEILHQRMWETNSYKTYEDHMMLYEALEKSMNRDHSEELLKDLAEARKKKKKRHMLTLIPSYPNRI
nr:hypothetical protein [Tanacetum cinerariifolium]